MSETSPKAAAPANMPTARPTILSAPPGFAAVTPLDKTRHARMGLKPGRNYAWCANLNAVFVSAAEFSRAALDLPLAFIRDSRSGDPMPVAVLGLGPTNLFVDAAGNWREPIYIPAYFRRHPFCLAELPAEKDQTSRHMVCVQEDQLAVVDNPLFDDKGEPTPAWEPIRKLLEAAEGARTQTVAFCRQLDALQLLAPFDALAMPKQGPQLRLQGLLRVEEEKLLKLPSKELKTMMEKGQLRAVFAHLISLENFAKLLDLSQRVPTLAA